MAVRDENSIHDPQTHIIRIEETVVDSTNIAPQVPKKVEKNGDSTQKTPSPHQLSGKNYGKVKNKMCVALYRAALEGDWATAKVLLGQDRSLLCGRITKNGETVLHIAAGAKQIEFVEKLLELIEPQDLTLKDRNGNSAFCFAVAAGAIQIAENMLKKNEKLLTTRGGQDVTPNYLAAIFGHRDMALYLYRKAKFNGVILSRDDKGALFFACLNTGLYDLAMQLLKDLPELAMARDKNQDTALHILARQPSSFAGRKGGLLKPLITSFKLLSGFISSFLVSGIKFNHNTDSTSTQALELVGSLWEKSFEQFDSKCTDLKFVLDAARFGNFEFLNELIRRYPELIHEIDENNHSIFHIAVLYRHANIFNLIFEIGFTKDVMATFEDNDGNNILHLAAKLPHPNRVNTVSNTALQMQRELLWFKEVEKVAQPSFREKKNSNGQTPRELFTQEHKELLSNGESWMKNTASSCMLVATIIATITFAAVFSVPGGNGNNRGIPISLRDALFQVFSISYAIVLSSSSISILMFLSILTTRYIEDDFLISLPFKLIVGLSSLYISIITMMIAFITTIFLAYHDRLNWVTIHTTLLASVPTTIFVLLHCPLLREILYATYRSRFLFKSSSTML